MLDPIYQAIGWLLALYYSFIPSLGIAIIMLTATVMLLLFPLTARQARSMIKMQQVQPEIKKIQQQYKDDKAKANEEILKFYQENKINPLSGCFPLIMQMPIFIALFGVLRGLSNTTAAGLPDPGSIPEGSQLYSDIVSGASSATEFLGMDLTVSPLDASGSFLETLPYFIVVALIVFTGWYQSRQTMARQRDSGAAANPQMQIVGKVMPIMFGVFSLNFVAGLNIYFVTSNAWRIGQQHLVLSKIYEQAKTDQGRTLSAESRDVTEKQDEGRAPKAIDRNTSRKKRKRRKR